MENYYELITNFFRNEERGRVRSLFKIFQKEINAVACIRLYCKEVESQLDKDDALDPEVVFEQINSKLHSLSSLLGEMDQASGDKEISSDPQFIQFRIWVLGGMSIHQVDEARSRLKSCTSEIVHALTLQRKAEAQRLAEISEREAKRLADIREREAKIRAELEVIQAEELRRQRIYEKVTGRH